eukprot:3051566-Pleurochrysis_carterae.AAC.1
MMPSTSLLTTRYVRLCPLSLIRSSREQIFYLRIKHLLKAHAKAIQQHRADRTAIVHDLARLRTLEHRLERGHRHRNCRRLNGEASRLGRQRQPAVAAAESASLRVKARIDRERHAPLEARPHCLGVGMRPDAGEFGKACMEIARDAEGGVDPAGAEDARVLVEAPVCFAQYGRERKAVGELQSRARLRRHMTA